MSDPSSTTTATTAAAKRRAASPAKTAAKTAAKSAAKGPAAKRPAATDPARRVAAQRSGSQPAGATAPARGVAARRQPAATPARRVPAKRAGQSSPVRAEQAVERGVVVATSAAPTRGRKLSGHLPPRAPQVTLPVIGWTFALPPRREWPWIGGVALVAALDIIDWPVALIIAIGHTIMTNSHNEQLRELADGIEAAL